MPISVFAMASETAGKSNDFDSFLVSMLSVRTYRQLLMNLSM